MYVRIHAEHARSACSSSGCNVLPVAGEGEGERKRERGKIRTDDLIARARIVCIVLFFLQRRVDILMDCSRWVSECIIEICVCKESFGLERRVVAYVEMDGWIDLAIKRFVCVCGFARVDWSYSSGEKNDITSRRLFRILDTLVIVFDAYIQGQTFPHDTNAGTALLLHYTIHLKRKHCAFLGAVYAPYYNQKLASVIFSTTSTCTHYMLYIILPALRVWWVFPRVIYPAGWSIYRVCFLFFFSKEMRR